MTTVVNNPTPAPDNGGTGFLIGTVILVLFVGILLYFAIPAIKNAGPIQVNVPAPQVTLPDTIKVVPEPAPAPTQ